MGPPDPPTPHIKSDFDLKTEKVGNYRILICLLLMLLCGHIVKQQILLWAYRGHFSLQNEPQNMKIGRGTSENHPIKADHLHRYQAAIRLSETPNLAQLASTLIRPIFTAIWCWMDFLALWIRPLAELSISSVSKTLQSFYIWFCMRNEQGIL